MAEKILIVDDEIACRRLIDWILQNQGYEVLGVGSGTEAIRKAIAEKPDLVILDVMMPLMDGFEVCKRLRADAITRRIPVIMMSAGRSLPDDVITGFRAGADDYLIKPFLPAELISRIHKVLG